MCNNNKAARHILFSDLTIWQKPPSADLQSLAETVSKQLVICLQHFIESVNLFRGAGAKQIVLRLQNIHIVKELMRRTQLYAFACGIEVNYFCVFLIPNPVNQSFCFQFLYVLRDGALGALPLLREIADGDSRVILDDGQDMHLYHTD